MQPVNGLSLESYLQLHKALTKNGNVVQSVTPIEECYYKISDLRHLLQLHGFTAGKFNRTELLAAMKGQELINPCSLTTIPSDQQPVSDQQASTTSSPSLPFTASDVCAVLGMPEPSSGDVQSLQVLHLSSTSGGVEAPATAGVARLVADNQPAQASGLTTRAAATGPAAGARAGAVAAQQPQHPYPDSANPPSAKTATQQLHNQHQQQAQLPERVPDIQDHPQLAAVCDQQQHRTSQSQQQQHQQQQQATSTQMHQHTVPYQQQPTAAAAAAATTATGTLHSLPQGEALQQLLAALLACQAPVAGSSSMPLQAAAQPQHPTSDLLQQLLACAGATGGPRPNTSCTAAHQPAATMPSTAPAAAAEVQTTAPETVQPASTAVAAVGGTTGPDHTHPSNHSGQGAAAAAVAPAVDPDELPGPSHTPWLKLQLQWFEASGILAAPAAAAAPEGSTGSLLGRRVGFVLLEEMQVAGPRSSILTLPAGVYEGMAVKYLGSSCQFEVCEAGCPGQHEFYRARILPPRVVPEGPAGSSCSAELAASLAQAHAAASGRPVLLILDLHPRLRSHSLEGLMQIDTPEQLQDAWVLLEHEDEPDSPAASQPVETAAAAAVPTAPQAQKRGRKPGSSSSRHGQCKRAKA